MTQSMYLRTEELPLESLTPFPGNAKRGAVDRIRESLKEHGQYRALVVRHTPDGAFVVLAGNHTLLALKAEGVPQARCELIACDDVSARKINIADNRLPELGGYDDDALAELLAALDGDLTGTGWGVDDLNLYMPGEPPDLDQLAEEYGEPDETEFWPTLVIKVSPDVRDDFMEQTDGAGGTELADRLAYLLDKARG